MNKAPYLSIVIPLFNKEKQIKRTIESVLNQNYKDFEIIVVNDGSTDNSLSIVESINDDRIRIVSQSNAGVSAARNRGLKEALGEYVFLLDADDCLLSRAFDLITTCEPADIVIGSFNQVNIEGTVMRKAYNKITGQVQNPYKEYCKKNIFIRIGNIFIKKSFLEQKGFLRTDLTLYEDEEWILRLIDGAKIISSNQIILEYLRVQEGLSHGFKPIEIEWGGIASVKDVKDKYKRQILGDFIFRRLVVRWKWKDWHGLKIIWHNNSWNLLYCMISFVKRALKGDFVINFLKDRYLYGIRSRNNPR